MIRLVRAELFKLRTTNLWWLFALATVLATAVMLVVNGVFAHSLLQPLAQYLDLESHGHAANLPPEFLARLTDEWTLGHSAVTQAAALYTAGQLPGVLLACLLGIVLITSEYQHQTVTTTFLLTPRRTSVVAAKLVTGVLLAGLAWAASTVLSLVGGAIFLHVEGFGSQLGHANVLRAMLLNLAAYLLWAVFGVGVGALIRHQLAATVGVTVLYLAGASAASTVFELLNTYVLQHDWVLTAQVLVPTVASAVMVSPTATFDQSPAPWVGAVVLLAYGIVLGGLGVTTLRRRDISGQPSGAKSRRRNPARVAGSRGWPTWSARGAARRATAQAPARGEVRHLSWTFERSDGRGSLPGHPLAPPRRLRTFPPGQTSVVPLMKEYVP